MNKMLLSLAVCALAAHAEPDVHTSLQGFSGLINTPDAEIMREGSMELGFSNQVDVARTRSDVDYTAEQYLVNVGLFGFLEVGGRLSEVSHTHRDLSANVKFQLPLSHAYLPTIAFGVQDLGGAASHYDAKYAVMSRSFWFLRASVGYGFDSKHLDGLFGGVEARVLPWASLMAEHDSRDASIALRLKTPHEWFEFGDLSVMAKKGFGDNDDVYVGVGLRLELGGTHPPAAPLPERAEAVPDVRDEAAVLARMAAPGIEAPDVSQTPSPVDLADLAEALAALGLENVDVGESGGALYLAAENNVFGHNDLDALGVMLGRAAAWSDRYARFVLSLKKSKTRVITFSGDLQAAARYFAHGDPADAHAFAASLRMADAPSPELAVASANDSFLRTRLELAPGLMTYVGTEVGVFDYLLSARPHLYWNLFEGVELGVLADIPVANSDDFDEESLTHGKWRSYGEYNRGSRIDSVMLHRSDNLWGVLNLFSAGVYDTDYYGAMNQSLFSWGNHTFKYKFGYFESDEPDLKEKGVYLGRYGYYMEAFDLYGEIQAGKYWHQDVGFDVTLKRFFGDVAIELFYQRTGAEFGSDTVDEFVGMGIELPLTPSKVSNYRYAQLKGTSSFEYSLRSTVNRDDGTNIIVTEAARDPQMPFEIETHLFNRNRLSLPYLRSHVNRMLEAYREYR